MDVLVRSQLNSVVQSYIGKQIMIVLPYSYTTGRNWNRHCIHGLGGDEAFVRFKMNK